MRALLAHDDEASRFAVEHYCYWAARQAASLVAALGGVDAAAFTAGIGYGSAPVRARIIGHLTWLGLELDERRNQLQHDSLEPAYARRPIWRVEANEELTIARHVHATVGGD
jgi:acetate kinase